MDRPMPRPRDLVVPVLLLGLLVQLAVAQVREPYPAVIMPRFSGVPGADGAIALRSYTVTATKLGHDAFTDDGALVLANIPAHFRAATLEHLIARQEDNDPEVVAWLSHRVRELTGESGWDSFEIERHSTIIRR
jgi:hypothetical protein